MENSEKEFKKELGLLDGTMLVVGSMIGSGIFIVSADIVRQVGSAGWLIAIWLLTSIITIVAAVSYGELSAMFPKAGGQYVYLKDKSLKDRLPLLAPVFASMLVKRAFETNGIVEDCETVLNASNKYRNGQDHISAYISEKIIKTDCIKDKIGKRGLQEGFKLWFELTQGSRRCPKGTELFDYMNKKFGQCKTSGWHYVKFVEPDDQDNDIVAEL